MNQIELPNDPALAAQVLNAEHTSKKIDMGFIGRVFGAASEKPGNIAGLCAVAAIATLIVIILLMPDSASLSKKDAAAIMGGIISLSLGFLFGKATN